MDRTLEAVRDYAALAKGVDRTFGIGTSALRDAANAKAFTAEFSHIAGVSLEVLSGHEEAASSFEGAVCGLVAAGRSIPEVLTVVDVGGGSTEFAKRTRPRGEPDAASLQIGAVRLTEQHLKEDPPSPAAVERCRQAVRAALRGMPENARPAGVVVAVGGTASTAAHMLQLTDEENARASVADIPAVDLSALLKATLAMPVRERKRMRGLPAQRADIFPAGLMILDEVVAMAAAPALVVSESDLLLGYVARHA